MDFMNGTAQLILCTYTWSILTNHGHLPIVRTILMMKVNEDKMLTLMGAGEA